MSLLSSLAQVAIQSALGGNGQSQTQNLVAGVLGMLQNSNTGGLSGLVEKFQKTGLGDVAASWVGTGDNKAVSPDQVVAALGQDQVTELAKQAGIPEEKGAEVLSQVLPSVVNEMTPDGEVPEPHKMGTLAKVILGGLGAAGVAMAAKAAASAYNNRNDDSASADSNVMDDSGSSVGITPDVASGAAPAAAANRTYTVVSGDSLSKIAKHVYGDGNHWMQIFEANRDKLSDPDRISPGQVLRIP
ncbi:conserved hypothetical protein [Crenothrix polyspora]|jgi:uncharacterized protein YidB (DUF937 family)/LysM repeat protein|uniref:Potassium binding protein Kbp n=1 Tax=Crenothrix polyspora TaxID=360316 RepID=A0A1R4HGZ2_9GAMM|nr:conserved hypothetical protein [Crenothrix polyspora]